MIYLCASYARQAEMRQCRDDLASVGKKVFSTWIDEGTIGDGKRSSIDHGIDAAHARRDLSEIRRCKILIAFTEPEGTPYGRGGRHFEAGFFAALMTLRLFDKTLVVVGPTENIFYAEPDYPKYATWADLMDDIRRRAAL